MRNFLLSIILVFISISTNTVANELNLAVASNFKYPMREIIKRFESSYAYKINTSFASTGKHYAQIVYGAPFDIFFSADSKRVSLLEEQNIGVKNSRFTYAIGKLAIYVPGHNKETYPDILSQPHIRHIAIANPRLAPYGAAAKQVLQKLELWNALKVKLVQGENITQAYHYVVTGNAQAGIVAYSQVIQDPSINPDSIWKIPKQLHEPILQQALVIKNSEAARVFVRFVKGQKILHLIKQSGYDIP